MIKYVVETHQEHVSWYRVGGQGRPPGRMTLRNCSGKREGNGVSESRRKSSFRRQGESLAQTSIEQNLYKPLNYLA